jgi:DNA-binding transcriptional regulator/RsmH inhibitor MraZ
VEETSNPGLESTVAEAPAGIFEAKCDDKGRLKLPVRFAVVLKRAEVSRVFITTIDLESVRIYPEKVWESNRKYFDEPGEDPETAEDISFIANSYGDFSAVDEHGRVLVPTNLRRELGIEKQSVWLEHYREHINVYPKKFYEERMNRARLNLRNKAKAFDARGFK